MGNYLPAFNTTKTKFQVWYLNNDQIIDVPSTLTLKQLKDKLSNINNYPKQIYYNWTSINEKDQNTTLQKVIEDHLKSYPLISVKDNVFTVVDFNNLVQSEQKISNRHNKLLEKLKSIQKVDEKQMPTYEIGNNGRIVFQGRQAAVFASAISQALGKSNSNPQKLSTLLQGCDSSQQTNRKSQQIGNLFMKIGLLGKNNEQITEQSILELTQKLKSSNEFSNFDPKFVYFIAQIYLKFMILNKGKIHYIDYKDVQDFGIQYIPSNSKIGIIGDFGTGLKDSIQLLSNMILKHDVDVILHLGDVYYAGTPLQYQVGIIKPLNQLRIKSKKQIRFYSIPGNHDYYSWGLPFLCFVKEINSQQFHKQKASYFCLRDQANKWQFLGMDTAYFDSNPFNQIYPGGVGPHVQNKELLWHKHRLENFSGSTVLMTHHQLFSIHERINGKLTKYRKFSCINPMLSAQMFEHMGKTSAWYWGHEHSLMLFKQNVFGLPKGRLLGNSSFHVMFNKQNPYSRQKGFPQIPYIVQDKQYLEKYLPVNPNIPVGDYFALSYAVIDMSKMDEQNNLPVEYWCSPSFSNDDFESLDKISVDEKKKIYFEEYLIYQQKIFSIQKLIKQRVNVKNFNKVYLRCQIGLTLNFSNQQDLMKSQTIEGNSQNITKKQIILINNQQGENSQIKLPSEKKNLLRLNLQGSAFEINILDQKYISYHKIWEFSLKLVSSQSQNNLYLGVVNNCVELIEIQSNDQIINYNVTWIGENMNHQQHTKKDETSIFYCQPVRIHNKTLNKSLTWQIINNEAYLSLQEPQYELRQQELYIQRINEQNLQCLWMFENQNLIRQ